MHVKEIKLIISLHQESDMHMRNHMLPGDMASYDRTPLGQSGRSRTVTNPYGGYSDTEVMGPTAENRLYGRDPYMDRSRDDRYGGNRSGGYYDDHRGMPPHRDPGGMPPGPPGPGYNENLGDERVRGPPPPPRQGVPTHERSQRIPRPIIADHAHGEFAMDSDIESVTSAFSSHSAPHARGRRPG